MNRLFRVALVCLVTLGLPLRADAATCAQLLKRYAAGDPPLPRTSKVRVTQEAVNSLWEKWATLRHPRWKVPYLVLRCPKEYVASSLLNEQRRIDAPLRDLRLHDVVVSTAGLAGTRPIVDESRGLVRIRLFEETEWFEKLRPVLARFAKDEDLLLLDFRMQGKSYEEIVELFRAAGIDTNAVKLRQQLHRFKQRLEKAGLSTEVQSLEESLEEVAVRLARKEALLRVRMHVEPEARELLDGLFDPMPRPVLPGDELAAESSEAFQRLSKASRPPLYEWDLGRWQEKAVRHVKQARVVESVLARLEVAGLDEDIQVLRKVISRDAGDVAQQWKQVSRVVTERHVASQRRQSWYPGSYGGPMVPREDPMELARQRERVESLREARLTGRRSFRGGH